MDNEHTAEKGDPTSIPDTIPSPGRARRVLVVADDEVGDAGLPTVLERHAGTSVELLVVVPARAGRLALWTSDDGPRRAAERRLDRSLARLRAAGIPAKGSSATPTRCSRWRTRCGSSRRTRSSSSRRRRGTTGSSRSSLPAGRYPAYAAVTMMVMVATFTANRSWTLARPSGPRAQRIHSRRTELPQCGVLPWTGTPEKGHAR
jgi:hypothetical protein